MTCDTWRVKLEPYADSELPEQELAELEEHMRMCPSCAADALERVQMKRMIRAAGARYAPTPQLRLRIEQSIRPRHKWFRWTAWWPKAAVAFALLIIVIGSAALWIRRSEQQRAVAEFADLHVTALASTNPVDVVSTDRHTVKPWFAGKLPFTFDLPDLQGSPFNLIGGRIVYFEHSPGAQLLFEVRKHRLSVFILQESGAAIRGGGATVRRELAFNMETWADGGLRYIVVSDASASDVRALSELLQRSRQ